MKMAHVGNRFSLGAPPYAGNSSPARFLAVLPAGMSVFHFDGWGSQKLHGAMV